MKALHVGLIGCGGFMRAVHVPNLQKNSKFKIYATMDIDKAAAESLCADTHAMYATTDIHTLLNDPNVDMVIIATWHDSHAELSVMAANAGKHILCEKPMAMNPAECKAVADAVKKNHVKYTVGYNRGMAPIVTKAKELLSPFHEKRMIYHRIQAYFPESHWTHLPEVGGGRFIGEGCHIFDLICELIDSPPVCVYASGGTYLNPELVKIPDSAIVTITFADGSTGVTLINSAGNGTLPKEATEIYCDQKAIQLIDFRRAEYYGFDGHEKIVTEYDSVDKGHRIELDKLADSILSDTDSPNGLVKAARAAIISYKVNESIRDGQPVAVHESEYIF